MGDAAKAILDYELGKQGAWLGSGAGQIGYQERVNAQRANSSNSPASYSGSGYSGSRFSASHSTSSNNSNELGEVLSSFYELSEDFFSPLDSWLLEGRRIWSILAISVALSMIGFLIVSLLLVFVGFSYFGLGLSFVAGVIVPPSTYLLSRVAVSLFILTYLVVRFLGHVDELTHL